MQKLIYGSLIVSFIDRYTIITTRGRKEKCKPEVMMRSLYELLSIQISKTQTDSLSPMCVSDVTCGSRPESDQCKSPNITVELCLLHQRLDGL